jgi:hypothetical protein
MNFECTTAFLEQSDSCKLKDPSEYIALKALSLITEYPLFQPK